MTIRQPWILIDTETNGLSAPVYTVELAAQRMRGWATDGLSFRRLVNQNVDIPPEASRVNGYTREILERDGEPPDAVYRDFAEYCGGLPIGSYNLEFDLDRVLLPEWKRLGIEPIGERGFCALRLAQRLLDPVPAGNCKLQTLRQYYHLPERGAHTALGDVNTTADLLAQVLRPLAEQQDLSTWTELSEFTEADWFPSRIAFGKFKGRDFCQATEDPELRGWIEWLAGSNNERSARMGAWYLARLHVPEPFPAQSGGPVDSGAGVVVYTNPEAEQLRQFIERARAELAEVEAQYMLDLQAVQATKARLFELLRTVFQERDRLRLITRYRAKFIDTLLREGEEEAKSVEEEYGSERSQSDGDYQHTADEMAGKQALSDEEASELKTIWKKLVRLYHPDRFANQPQKLEAYTSLTSAINKARDDGDLELIREIADDPEGFMLRQGWQQLDFAESEQLTQLQRLFDSLRIEIITILDAHNDLREGADFELHRLSAKEPTVLEQVAAEQAEVVEQEIEALRVEADRLAEEIEQLTGEPETVIA